MSKKYIKNFMMRDKNALLSISKCGHVSHNELKKFIADSRIKNYVRDGLVEKEVFNKSNGEQLIGYKLTGEGRKFVEKNYGFDKHQIAQSLTHDLGISNKYFSLTEQEQSTWQTETQLRYQLQEEVDRLRNFEVDRWRELTEMMERREISVADCSYVQGGVTIAYEVVTNSYGRAELQAKEEYGNFMNTSIEYGRV
ncbi:hypothetical protein [Clostridium perfringens]|uniref:hypothetical protein n=1 Tax=Clostridium perfringens TaxID=1502 RepID=UPI0024BC98F3|nr:hypothetical protein [Clostridium perfringens]